MCSRERLVNRGFQRVVCVTHRIDALSATAAKELIGQALQLGIVEGLAGDDASC